MGKRSNFERIEKDFYRTIDERAYSRLNDVMNPCKYYEPCVGEYDLVNGLNPYGFKCVGASDIEDYLVYTHDPELINPFEDTPTLRVEYRTGTYRKDALSLTPDDVEEADYIITNPPWTRKILHPLIEHFITLKPTWLLFDANWMFTKQASEYLEDYCTHIAAIGRLKWIPGTTMSGKDDCCWYRFVKNKKTPTQFIGR